MDLVFYLFYCSLLLMLCGFLGFRKTILLDRKHLVGLFDQYNNGSLNWDDFSLVVNEVHAERMLEPTKRIAIPDRPKEEDYFYANPEECLQQPHDLNTVPFR